MEGEQAHFCDEFQVHTHVIESSQKPQDTERETVQSPGVCSANGGRGGGEPGLLTSRLVTGDAPVMTAANIAVGRAGEL